MTAIVPEQASSAEARADPDPTAMLTLSQTQALLHCAALVTSSLEQSELLRKILEAAKQLIPVKRTSLFLLDNNSGELYSVVAEGTTMPLRFASSSGIAGSVMTTCRSVHVANASSHPQFHRAVASRAGYVPRDLLVTPILVNKIPIGVIELLDSTRDGGFTLADVALLEVFASYCSIALANTRRYEESVRAIERAFLFEFARLISGPSALSSVLESLMMMARQLASADRASVFLVDAPAHELYTFAADGASEIRLRIGSGIAGYVAATGETLNIIDCYKDPRFDGRFDVQTGYLSRSLLCVPLRWRESVVGVVMLLNKRSVPGHFTAEDVSLCEAFAVLVSSVINSTMDSLSAGELAAQIESVVRIAEVFANTDDPLGVVASIMGRAAKRVGAQRFSVFVYDAKLNALRASANNITGEDLGQVEIRVPLDASSIVGAAAVTGDEIVLDDAYSDPRFNATFDKSTGYRTRSMLVVPVRATPKGRVLAVVQLINKIGPDGAPLPFTTADRTVVRAFGAFCAIGISADQGVSLLAIEGTDGGSDGGTAGGGGDGLNRSFDASAEEDCADELVDLLTWNFRPYSCTFAAQLFAVVGLFDHFQLCQRFGFERRVLLRFVREVARRYNGDIPYHTFAHAVDVTHCLSMFAIQGDLLARGVLTPLDLLTLLLAGLVHDIDHTGLTNTYHAATSSPFALAHPHGSVMESHHVAIAVSLLARKDCAVLSGLSAADARLVWEGIVSNVMATDAAVSKDRAAFEALIQPGGFDGSLREHRLLAMRQLIRAADISNAFKPWEICEHWADAVAGEFWAQGDLERAQGLASAAIFDRTRTPLPTMQVGFVQHVARPFFAGIVTFVPALQPQLDSMDSNLARWRELSAAAAK
eukprot:c8638_g1_i1.p1 GENE.c8638_g1_i1~~c8638_g1_i1.p1  ORF type:complete len:916 (+),score=170.36 c8638_g1_i1:115-2748(+)